MAICTVTVLLGACSAGTDPPDVELWASFDDASGLKRGKPVLIAGIQVGRVTEIELDDDNRARVGFRIRGRHAQRVRVDEDPVACLRRRDAAGCGARVEMVLMAGLTMLRAPRGLVIRPGTSQARAFGAGEGVPAIDRRNFQHLFDTLDDERFARDLPRRLDGDLAAVGRLTRDTDALVKRLHLLAEGLETHWPFRKRHGKEKDEKRSR